MKKFLYLGFSIVLAFILQSCLKDKGFERQTYGTQSTTSAAVGFAQGSGIADTSIVTGAVGPSTTPLISDNVIQVALEGTPPLATATTVNITLNPGLLANTGLTPFPAGAVTVPASVVIPAGAQFVNVPITLVNSSLLSLTESYGIGLTISSASLPIVGTRKNVVAQYNIKNKYDGVYSVTGTFQDLSAAGVGFTGNYPYEVELVTTGPTSVDVKRSINGELTPGYLFFTATGGGSFYGSFGLTMTFDPATDVISDLHNYFGDPSKPMTGVGTPSTGTGAPLFQSANGRRATLDPTGINAYIEATKTVKIKYFLVQPSVVAVGPRATMNETWVYEHERD